eukprot:scaffold14762_cov137-Isochrysis_galbana.AAC.2
MGTRHVGKPHRCKYVHSTDIVTHRSLPLLPGPGRPKATAAYALALLDAGASVVGFLLVLSSLQPDATHDAAPARAPLPPQRHWRPRRCSYDGALGR